MVVFLIFGVAIFFFPSVFKRTFNIENYSKTIVVGGKNVRTEIADTPAKIEQGLSDKEKMCSDCGMLFVFDQKGVYPFWMRRMHFDIDILWLAGDRIVDITFSAKAPQKEEFDRPKTVYQSKVPVDKVLEVNAGWVEKNGIKVGDVVKY